METQDIEKTVVAQAQSPEATIIGASVACPVCKTENAPTEQYCGECGFLLSATPGEEAPVFDTSAQPRLTDASGRVYLLHEGENSIGREAVGVLLSDATVSRSHAKLTLEAGTCRLEDVGSSNGTYAGGVRIQPGETVEVSDGAELKFGSAILTLAVPAPAEVEEAVESPEEPAEESPAEEAAAEEVAEPVEESVEVPAEEPEPEEVAEVESPEPAWPTKPGRSLLAPVATLVLTTDPEKSYPVMPGANTVGRRGTNTIVLDDAYVSGAHAELIADEGGFWVTDLGSTNGTTLNGDAIAPNARMALNPGDEIVFGRTALRFDVPQPEEAPEPPGE